MSIRFRTVWAVLILSLVGSAASDTPNATRATDVATGEQLITPQKLKMHLSFIASDELEGRDTPSRGLDLAARYIASHMEFYGYKPAGDDGTFYQKIPMTRRKASSQSKLRLQAGDKRVEFAIGVDYVGRGDDAQGKLVFAGFGLSSNEAGYDDYSDLDVKEKLVVCLDGFPEGFDQNLFKIEQKFGSRTMKTAPNKPMIAKQHGALGTITIRSPEFTTGKDNKPSQFDAAKATLNRTSLTLDSQSPPNAISIDLTADAGKKVGELLGVDLAEIQAKINQTKKPQSVPLDASFDASLDEVEKTSTQNVIAFQEGSDPQLKEEIVLFSAHYDHVGMMPLGGSGGSGQRAATVVDRIFNGADDDGSGTVGILNLAESFAAVNRPRRSLLFVWHCGEEKGLWGSSYYVQHPTKPLDKIVANINIDMIGRNLDDKPENIDHFHLIGAAKTSTELNDLVHKVCSNRMRIDETDRANYFMRSDHFNYARNKIPVAFFFTGEHKDYHKPSDEVQSILFDKMKRILDIIFECGLELSNREVRPTFTGQGF